MCALALRSTPDPALAGIRDRLTQQFALHRRTAPFWTAYQGLQQEVIRAHPRDHVRLCNAMADIAEDLGAVTHAQLLDGNTGCTPR
ncbi:hypothetical protein BA766_17970 [Stenotrophomonas maltophilia]|uniref:hypothetical protein n=1 Tax=Stenotrophomonas maltophilia TaxID=40324 RepID=UPI000810E4D8|nr:hypothetical protein [Stenotrophomonas maltophilia]MBH1495055.1 hypothetical protein [Stenotrophomonas maltophilia]MBN4963180.1 hypothetical protein [Stenotrophomonas maltophilia]OCK45475.1 hypothetical protein BA766_17970 [Stenotrophomonas maltophilia]